jgi:hypothetical protein
MRPVCDPLVYPLRGPRVIPSRSGDREEGERRVQELPSGGGVAKRVRDPLICSEKGSKETTNQGDRLARFTHASRMRFL